VNFHLSFGIMLMPADAFHSTYHVRQAMREYLSSENMLPATDRSLLLRLKNTRYAASRAAVRIFGALAAQEMAP
jgi:hypothetical protein